MPESVLDVLPQPRRPSLGLFERWPRSSDLVLAALAFAATLLMWMQGRDSNAWTLNAFPGIATYLVGFAAHFALLWRRSHPFRVHAVFLIATVLVLLIGQAEGLVGLVVSLYSLGRYEADRDWSIAGAAIAFVFVVTDLDPSVLPGAGAWLSGGLVLLVWYVGRRRRFRGEYLRLLEERAAQMERERHADAQRAVIAERTRIAREMHDVIAHQVSLMTVQAGAARTVLAADPEAAAAAIGAVEQAGRRALSELRHLLGVLRQDEPGQALDPQPGIDDLPALVRRVEEAGPSVALMAQGALENLPARVQLTVYRIVQESLTNVIKHGGPDARVTVTLDVDNASVRIAVIDEGGGDPVAERAAASGGHGIAGMRERAASLGGELSAGRGVSGGFEVRATLPVGGGE